MMIDYKPLHEMSPAAVASEMAAHNARIIELDSIAWKATPPHKLTGDLGNVIETT